MSKFANIRKKIKLPDKTERIRIQNSDVGKNFI